MTINLTPRRRAELVAELGEALRGIGTPHLNLDRFDLAGLYDVIHRPETFDRLTMAQLAEIHAEIHRRSFPNVP